MRSTMTQGPLEKAISRRQELLTRNSEIRAETDYNKAIANLQKATSTTFQMNNIEIVSPVDKK